MYTFILSARRKWSPNLVTLRTIYSWECLSKRYSAYCCIINQMPSLFLCIFCMFEFFGAEDFWYVFLPSAHVWRVWPSDLKFHYKSSTHKATVAPMNSSKICQYCVLPFFCTHVAFLKKNTVDFYGKALKKCVLRKGWGIILVLRQKD